MNPNLLFILAAILILSVVFLAAQAIRNPKAKHLEELERSNRELEDRLRNLETIILERQKERRFDDLKR